MNPVMRVGRLWRTARHLRLVQIYGRVRFRFARPRAVPSPPPAIRDRAGRWIEPSARRASLVGPSRFRFLHQEEELSAIGWDHARLAKLWRYNQHYFDDLTAEGWRERDAWHQSLVARWIAENPPGAGSGWEPYPTSLRIINWIKWSLVRGELPAGAQVSLAMQARWLMQRLEWHLLGNHLFVNAKALVFAGLYFQGSESESWLQTGLNILVDQLDEQFLPDGGQFELSPMYHALALEDLLDLLNIGSAYPGTIPASFTERLRTKAGDAIAWLFTMSHPDGRISFFNDAAFGVAPDNDRLLTYADQLSLPRRTATEPLKHLVASGYARLTNGPAVLIADLARIGPDYLPGHAHADTLSFELSLYGQRVLVNSGTSEYGDSSERLRQRGTAAHNTVVVAGVNSSEVWSGFRVGRRARPHNVRVDRQGGTLLAEAYHDGYAHLPGQPQHHRCFTLADASLRIEDRVTASQPAYAFYHLHPLIQVESVSSSRIRLVLPDGRLVQVSVGGGPLQAEAGSWHPEFGRVEMSTRLIVSLEAGRAAVSFSWDADCD